MSRKQTIYRTVKNRENPYVMVDKKLVECRSLSFRAKAVLIYILSKPDHWKVNVKDIMKYGKEGRDAIYACIKELMEHGYIERICSRVKGKVLQYDYIVNEQAGVGMYEEQQAGEGAIVDSEEGVYERRRILGKQQEAIYTREELAKKSIEVQEKIRKLYEEESVSLRIV